MAENELLRRLWDEPMPDAKPSVLTSTTEQQTTADTLNRAWLCLPGLEMQLSALINCQKGLWVWTMPDSSLQSNSRTQSASGGFLGLFWTHPCCCRDWESS